MTYQSDIAIYDKIGELVLVAEVRGKIGTDRAWAAKMRRNMLAHGRLPNAPFFLLALPDRFYLWVISQHTVDADNFEDEPDYDVAPIAFKEYAQKMGTDIEELSESGFEFLLTAWLRELARGTEAINGLVEWLVDSGLLNAVQNGNVVTEVVL